MKRMVALSVVVSLALLAGLVWAIIARQWIGLGLAFGALACFQLGRKVGDRQGTLRTLEAVQRRLRWAKDQSGKGR
jgi:hypothetical protein